MTRPSPVLVDDAEDAPIRHDINSDDIRRTYPDLPRRVEDRNTFVSLCDHWAYQTISHTFPDFRPPTIRATVPRPTAVSRTVIDASPQPSPMNRDVVCGERGCSRVDC